MLYYYLSKCIFSFPELDVLDVQYKYLDQLCFLYSEPFATVSSCRHEDLVLENLLWCCRHQTMNLCSFSARRWRRYCPALCRWVHPACWKLKPGDSSCQNTKSTSSSATAQLNSEIVWLTRWCSCSTISGRRGETWVELCFQRWSDLVLRHSQTLTW